MAVIDDFRYISKAQFKDVLDDLNIDETEDGGLSAKQQTSLLKRANGDLESALVERFVVPLVGNAGPFSTAPEYSRQKVLNAVISKITQLIGLDKQKNIVVESTERYIDIKKADYNGHVKDLLNHKRIFEFKLQDFSSDRALQPVQVIGVARGDNKRESFLNDDEEFL